MARELADLTTPAALVDLDRMAANLDRLAGYARGHGLALRPHIKTHKTPELAREQLRRGAVGLTVATVREAEVMAPVSGDLLLAHPPVSRAKLERLMALPEQIRLTVGLDAEPALDALSAAAAAAGRTVGVLVEVDTGMHRVGVQTIDETVALARLAADLPGIAYRGIMTYPGHIRQPIDEQAPSLEKLSADLRATIAALGVADLTPTVVSGGSTPTAWLSHLVPEVTEIRSGTYIFNDRTTAEIGACGWEDCAYTVLAAVVSTAAPGQAVVDAGSKALAREPLRASAEGGFGALLDRPEVEVRAMSEEHGLLDLSRTDWTPQVGELVRIVPNHVCVSVSLQNRLWGIRDGAIETTWEVAARGWSA